MNQNLAPSLGLLYPGDRATRDRSDPTESRFAPLFEAFSKVGIPTHPIVYNDEFADEVADQLRHLDGVLVWSNPIESGRRRGRLDTVLREAAQAGVFVSTHPDTILRLGTKDVLLDVRNLPFGSDSVRIDTLDQLTQELPTRLLRGARVLKQYRGHSGIGVWRVEQIGSSQLLKVRHAQRGSEEETIDLAGLKQRLADYFEPDNGGHMIDQAWQPRLVDGIVRAYLVEGRVAGFGHQAVNALHPDSLAAGSRLYFSAEAEQFQPLKKLLETGWIEQLSQCVGLTHDQLPMLWDCDFMLGNSTPGQPDRFVLCEINVSSVSPFPPSAIDILVSAVQRRLARKAGHTPKP